MLNYPSEFVNEAAANAKNLLAEIGEFRPYAYADQSESPGLVVSTDSEGTAGAALQGRCDDLEAFFADNMKEYDFTRVAVVANVSVIDPRDGLKKDAIRVALETHEGLSLYIFFPYTMGGSSQIYEKPFMSDKPRKIFRI